MNRARALLLTALAASSALAVAAPLAPPAAAKTSTPNCSAPYYVAFANWEFCWQLDNLRVQGIELNDVRYMGERVLWKAGVPFSITRYHMNAYGPYKDAFGNAGAAGLPGYGRGSLPIAPAQCPRFLGTGTLLQGGHVCLETIGGPNPRVALWTRFDVYNYRFANGWILHADGTFEPKVLLGGNLIDYGSSACGSVTGAHACQSHFHHVYWRFDFDVAGEAGDNVQEFRRAEGLPSSNSVLDPACSPSRGGAWCTFQIEGVRERTFADFTKWRVADFDARNDKGHARSFEIVPNGLGPADGTSTADFWAFAYKGDSAELGYQVSTNPRADSSVTAYADGQIIRPADVVVWYAEHVFHEPRDEEGPNMIFHTTGPKIAPRNFLGSNLVESTYP